MQRYQFDSLLEKVRDHGLRHADIVVYAVLTLVWDRYAKDGGTFFASKRDLRRYSGIKNVGEPIRRLHDRWEFLGGARLFDFVEDTRGFRISSWAVCMDPDEGEENVVAREVRRERLRKAILDARRKANSPWRSFPDVQRKFLESLAEGKTGEQAKKRARLSEWHFRQLLDSDDAFAAAVRAVRARTGR